MQILAAGISIRSKVFSMDRARGFTILEILVVVAVISMIASTILLKTNFNRPEDKLKEHSSRVGKTLKLLMQEAIINDTNYAISLVPGGYMVLIFNAEEWVPSEDKFILSLQTRHEYSDELIIDNQIIKVEKKEKPDPHILILASGEMTSFEWNISDLDNQLHSKVSGNLLGDIMVEGPEVVVQ